MTVDDDFEDLDWNFNDEDEYDDDDVDDWDVATVMSVEGGVIEFEVSDGCCWLDIFEFGTL